MKPLTDRQKANRIVKYTGIFYLLLAGAGFTFIRGYGWFITSMVFCAGLFMLLCAPERIDDERIRQLKLQAIAWGYAGGLLGLNFYDLARMGLRLKHLPELSAYDSLLIVTALALGLFHYLRWRDGRRDRTGAHRIQSP
jgi:hypothetical protein